MKIILLLTAAAAAFAASPAPDAPRMSEPYWTKAYSTAPYKEIRTGELALRSWDNDLPKFVAAIEKNGGKLDQPLTTAVVSIPGKSLQTSFSAPGKKIDGVLKALKKLGELSDLAVRPMGTPIPLDEIRVKIDRIMKEKSAHGAELAKVPAAAEAQEEVLEQLLLVEEVAKHGADAEIRVNLLVKQK